jgi:hypothetical protein
MPNPEPGGEHTPVSALAQLNASMTAAAEAIAGAATPARACPVEGKGWGKEQFSGRAMLGG